MIPIHHLFQDSYQSALKVYPQTRDVYDTFWNVLQSVADNHLKTTLFGQAKELLDELEEDRIDRHKCIGNFSSLDLSFISEVYSNLSTTDSSNKSLKETLSILHPFEQRGLNYLNAINELAKVFDCINEINQSLTRLSNNSYFAMYANRTREISIILDEIKKLTISITVGFQIFENK
jgi:hypothetical protein